MESIRRAGRRCCWRGKEIPLLVLGDLALIDAPAAIEHCADRDNSQHKDESLFRGVHLRPHIFEFLRLGRSRGTMESVGSAG